MTCLMRRPAALVPLHEIVWSLWVHCGLLARPLTAQGTDGIQIPRGCRVRVYVCSQRALAGSPVALRVLAAAVDCGASTVRLAGDGAAVTVVASAVNRSLTTVQLRDRFGNTVDPRRPDAACGGRAVADVRHAQGAGGGRTVELVADVDSPGTLSAPLTVAGRYALQVGVGVLL